MPLGLWGATDQVFVQLPSGPIVYGLLAFYAGLTALLLYRFRKGFQGLSGRTWVLILLLTGLSFISSQLFPITFSWQHPVLQQQSDLAAVNLLAAFPYLLAGLFLNPAVAIVVGFVAGLGRALGQTHSLFDPFYFALAAGLAAVFMQQRYRGRLFAVLRHPISAGVAGQASIAVMVTLQAFLALLPLAGILAALDLASFVGIAGAVPLMAEGFVGGGLAAAVGWLAPQWRPGGPTQPSPLGSSIQRQVTVSFLWFAVAMVALSAGALLYLSSLTLNRSLMEQVALDADASAARVPALQADLANLLVQYSADERLQDDQGSEQSKALNQLSRAAPQFSEVLLVTQDGLITRSGLQSFATAPEKRLTLSEQQSVLASIASGRTELVSGQAEDDTVFSLVVPFANGPMNAALVGRVAQSGLDGILGDMGTSMEGANTYIVDGQSRVLMGTGSGTLPTSWTAPESEHINQAASTSTNGQLFESLSPTTGERQLNYFTPVPGSSWVVVASVPRQVVLQQALGVIGPVAILLLVVSLLFFANVAAFGRSVSGPIARLAQASQAIASGGGLEEVSLESRDDELGELSNAFVHMQRSLRLRLEELGLLLRVSNEVAASMNISQGMPAVLQGVLRGTGAAGVRAVVRNPNATYPLVFAEGPAAESMADLDRTVMSQVRQKEVIALSTNHEVEESLGVKQPPIEALFAVSLKTAADFQGVLYLGYARSHQFDDAERNLIYTLAGQAAVLVQNAYLFSAAESGRRRLAAILASTTNAVIVTDQTDRVLLVNPAMEKLFGLDAQQVNSRPVADVISPAVLADRLGVTGRALAKRGDGKLEFSVNGRDLLANIGTVYGTGGQAMGRVAVMHDISDFRELDRMKSEFLAGITHDLLSPLTYMQNYTSMLPMIDDTSLQEEYIGKIMGGIERMTTLVNDLMELARIDAGLNLEVSSFSIGKLLEQVAEEYRTHAEVYGLTIQTIVSPGLSQINGDPRLVRRAITNLVSNAIKYAPESGTMTLSARTTGNYVVIGVADQGPGIPTAEQARLFERFYRVDQTAAGKPGSGLGLAIVKSVVELHGGRVKVESILGEGSTFYFSLPIVKS